MTKTQAVLIGGPADGRVIDFNCASYRYLTSPILGEINEWVYRLEKRVDDVGPRYVGICDDKPRVRRMPVLVG